MAVFSAHVCIKLFAFVAVFIKTALEKNPLDCHSLTGRKNSEPLASSGNIPVLVEGR